MGSLTGPANRSPIPTKTNPSPMRCPHCGKTISERTLAQHLGARGGGSPKRKRTLSTDRAKALARARWAGHEVLYQLPGDEHIHTGRLTTRHAASSYGLPVLVDARTEEPLGNAEVAQVLVISADLARPWVEAARRAGYRVEAA